MKELFSDLRRGSGTVVISSAGGLQSAFEGNQWNYGVFTCVTLEGLRTKKADQDKNGEITITELQDYVAETLPKLTDNQQVPTFRQGNQDMDFRIW